MDFESELAKRIVSRGRMRNPLKAFGAVAVAVLMAATVFALSPQARADLVLLDEVNIGDTVSEGTGTASRISGWSHIWDPTTIPAGGWGGFDSLDDSNIQGARMSLRTAWAYEGGDLSWATVTLNAKTQVRLLQIRALDGLGDDSFRVFVNNKLVYTYEDTPPTFDNPEIWSTHQIPVKGEGSLVVKIVATAAQWGGFNPWGQLGINWVRLYGVGGFDMYGYNYGARLYVGWLGNYDRYMDGTDNAWLVMKWSKDWTPMADEPIGAWVTNHYSWYSNDYDEANWYGYSTRAKWDDMTAPSATYLANEFLKIQKVSEDPGMWMTYEAGGAYDALWGHYDSWWVLGDWVITAVGTYDHDVSITVQTYDSATGSFGGLGAYPAGDPSTVFYEKVDGSIVGTTVTMTFTYYSDAERTQATGYIAWLEGTIDVNDGSMSGTFTDTNRYLGTWESTSGHAFQVPKYVVYQDTIDVFDAASGESVAHYDLCTTSPFGLGKPIF